MIAGLDWSVSAHAKDIWTLPEWEKRAKLGEADWVVTCTENSRIAIWRRWPPQPDCVGLCYHGLDLGRFPVTPLRLGSTATAATRGAGHHSRSGAR